jgi:hypothetical protein
MRCLLLLLISLNCVFLSAQQKPLTAKGRVAEDLNYNGAADKNEPGIPGVIISNGVQITKTCSKGNYSIPIIPGQVLFAVKPSGWAAPVCPLGLQQNYYIHKPGGSPPSAVQGSKPTGPLPKNIDFTFTRQNEPENFSFLLFGDPQATNQHQIYCLAQRLYPNLLDAEQHAFMMSMGDNVNDNLQDFSTIVSLFAHIGLPKYFLIGNHDIDLKSPSDSLSAESYEAFFGPRTTAFQYGGAHFIMLDNVIYRPEGGRKYTGGITEPDFKFMEAYLEQLSGSETVMVFMHIPLFQEVAPYYEGIETFRDADRRRFLAMLSPFANSISFSAHTHFQQHYFFSSSYGWKGQGSHWHFNAGTLSGDWYNGFPMHGGCPQSVMRDGTPVGYATVNIAKGEKPQIDYTVLGSDTGKQMHISLEKEDEKYFLYANYFIGNQFSELSCSIYPGTEKISMERVVAADPSSARMRQQMEPFADAMPRRIASQPFLCQHLWRAEIPAHQVQGKILRLKVTAECSGKTASAEAVFTGPAGSGSK